MQKLDSNEIWIVGNGPSTVQQDLTKLSSRVTFCSNQFFLHPGIAWDPTFYAVEDRRGIANHHEVICQRIPKSTKCFFEVGAEKMVNGLDSTFLKIERNHRRLRFSSSNETYFSGFCVTYLQMQIAYQLGFKVLNLIGCDHSRGHFVSENEYHDGKPHNNQRLKRSRDFIGFGVDWLKNKGVKVLDYTLNGNLKVVPKRDFSLIN